MTEKNTDDVAEFFGKYYRDKADVIWHVGRGEGLLPEQVVTVKEVKRRPIDGSLISSARWSLNYTMEQFVEATEDAEWLDKLPEDEDE